MTDLADIFRSVHSNFIWRPDEEKQVQWNGETITIKDDWTYMTPDEGGVYRGDCEDFCLTISKIAEEAGYPVEDHLFTYCETETKEGHMILEINGRVFDNRQRRLTTLLALKRAGYRKFARPEGNKLNNKWKFI